MSILTPFGDGAKFVVVDNRPTSHSHTLFFVDGHGYSRAVATTTVTDPNGTELEWLGASAGAYHRIPCERSTDGTVQQCTLIGEQLELPLGIGHD